MNNKKAKELRKHIEPLLTKCKTDTTHNRRILFSYLQDKESIKELFGVISDKVADRPGGYTRIIKLPRRIGDAADMAMIELVDFNTIYGKDTEAAAAKKTRRSRRSSGAKATTETSTPAPVAAAEETIVEANETIETTEVTETTEATEVTETTTEVTETTTEATETTTEENNA